MTKEEYIRTCSIEEMAMEICQIFKHVDVEYEGYEAVIEWLQEEKYNDQA